MGPPHQIPFWPSTSPAPAAGSGWDAPRACWTPPGCTPRSCPARTQACPIRHRTLACSIPHARGCAPSRRGRGPGHAIRSAGIRGIRARRARAARDLHARGRGHPHGGRNGCTRHRSSGYRSAGRTRPASGAAERDVRTCCMRCRSSGSRSAGSCPSSLQPPRRRRPLRP
ncbi:hypothetical protein DFJ74DRAFT_673655 [Hyaloraphidium curvatum]|nr:hypothetical protein DFJ74DRAFT_673655 [Hyaloraphidium curvatum]